MGNGLYHTGEYEALQEAVSPYQVRERYAYCVKTNASYEPLLKTKINMPSMSPNPANIWTPDGQRGKNASSWLVEIRRSQT